MDANQAIMMMDEFPSPEQLRQDLDKRYKGMVSEKRKSNST